MTTTTEQALVNPLREGLRQHRTPEPCIAVIYGASGDLTKRKLMPALWRLAQQGLLPPQFAVVGVGRQEMSDAEFRERMTEAVGLKPGKDAAWDSFAAGIYYVQSGYDSLNGHGKLNQVLQRIDQERGTCGNRLFYLATPPQAFPQISYCLGELGMSQPPNAWARIVIEKPFGHDLQSARQLNAQLHEAFDESQVFRIDHYLGKETVQNIMAFRFGNGIFEPLWNRRYIDHIEITQAESIGLEGRGGYYEQSGVIRDMIQNHLLQILAMVAMEPPAAFKADAVRNEKVKVLQAIRHIPPAKVGEFTVRGQYGPGSIAGQDVPGYREEEGVAPDSVTETYAAIKLYIDNWRWAGVPIYIRSGKRLPKRVTEVAIDFHHPPLALFSQDATQAADPNELILRIQPDEGISLTFAAKLPGPAMDLRPVHMDFSYGASFGVATPDAYERLLLDAMLGDQALFTRADEVEAAWAFITPIIAGWQLGPRPDFPNYPAGTWGPEIANAFIERDGWRWRRP